MHNFYRWFWILTNLIAGGMLLSTISGWSTIFTTSALAIVITAYLISGGFNSVVRTDVIQFFSLILIGIIIVMALYQYDGTANHSTVSITGNEELPIGRIISFILIGLLFPMGSAELWQRVYAADTKADYFKATTIASVSFIIVGGILSFICYKLMIMDSLQTIPPELRLVKGVAAIVSDIHPLLAALWFLVFSAAILSSADTFIYTTASSAVQDIFLRLGLIKETEVVQWIRYGIVILAVFGVVGSVVFKDIVSVTFYFLGLTLILAVASYITWLTNKITTATLLPPIFIGFIVTTYFAISQGISITTSIIALVVTTVIFLIELTGIYTVAYFKK